MWYNERRVTTRVLGILVAGMTTLVTACGEPTGTGNSTSSFSAEIRGARNERLSGSATASGGESWARELVVTATLPNAGTFSGIVLASSDLKTTVSFVRDGTELPVGPHRIGRLPNTPPSTAPMFSSGYVVRDGDRLQVFTADSGSLAISETGQRVKGVFTAYYSRYSIIKQPTPAQVGQVLTPLATGTSPVTISGTFDAGRR